MSDLAASPMGEPGNERKSLIQDAPQSVRDRIAEALLSHTGSRMYGEWEALMDWEDRMLAFANEAAGRADALQARLNNVEKSLRVLRGNLAGSVSPDEQEFWLKHFDNVLTEVRGGN